MERSPRVAVLLMDGMWAHDVANTIQVFGDGTPLRGAVPCEFEFVSDTELVRLDHGLSARATTLEAYGSMPDLVCVPGFVDPLPNLDAAPVQLAICADWLSRAHNAGAEVASLGSGTFVLAAAGLLSGVECTVHHAFFDDFRKMFPQARVCANKILTHDASQGVWTSAGGASGLDLCLSLLAHLAGPAAASACAEAMNLWRPHSLDTSSDAFGMPTVGAAEERVRNIDDVCLQVRATIDRPWTVAQMARSFGMSRRTFERHFSEATGETPRAWLTTQRFELACSYLAQTDLPLPIVAARVGLSSADVLYRLFLTQRGESPTAYRRRFSAA